MKNNHPFSGIVIRYLPSNHIENNKHGYQNDVMKSTLINETYLDDEIHIDLCEIENLTPFLDIGIMIGQRKHVAAVVVDIPWNITPEDINDLGHMLNGEKSVSEIFNEIIHYDGFAEGNFANISFRRHGVDVNPFSLLRLPPQSFDIKTMLLNDRGVYTRVTINIPFSFYSLNDESVRQSAYIRFRIKNIPPSVYSYKITPKEIQLSMSYTEQKIYYFQINTLQKTPKELLNRDYGLYFPKKLTLIKFNIITQSDNENITTNNHFYRYSPLTSEREGSENTQRRTMLYKREHNEIKNYFFYQWMEKKDDEDFAKDLVVLGRFSYKKNNYTLLIRFIIFFIISSALGNALWEISIEIANSPPNIIDIIKSKSEQLTIFFILEIIIYIDIIIKKIPCILNSISFKMR